MLGHLKEIPCPFLEPAEIPESAIKNFYFKKNSLLFSESSKTSEVYFLRKGSVKLIRRHRDGREFIIKYVKKGCLCCMPLFNGGRFLMDAITLEDSEITGIRIESLKEYISSRIDIIAPKIITCMLEMVHHLIEIIDDLAFLDVQGRLLKNLSMLSSIYGDDYIRLTHQDLASMAATVREVTTRVMADLRKKGIIDRSNINGFRVNIKRLHEVLRCD